MEFQTSVNSVRLCMLLQVDHEVLTFFGTRYGYWLGIARLDTADRSPLSYICTDLNAPEFERPKNASSVTTNITKTRVETPRNVTYSTLVCKTAAT